MAKSSKYYDITNLLSTKAQYLMLLGQRSNGKSYQVKETILKDAYKYIKPFQASMSMKSPLVRIDIASLLSLNSVKSSK